ncbi:hypothetical protein MIMGU_mgv1a0238522mg, partial [Erythranthe guttata]
TKDK